MTPDDFKHIRHALGLSTLEMGRALGYQGTPNAVRVQIRQYESGARQPSPWIARLYHLLSERGSVPIGWLEDA